jgi:hypothetical protein
MAASEFAIACENPSLPVRRIAVSTAPSPAL